MVWGGDADCAHEWGANERTPWANRVPGPNGANKNPTETRPRPKTTGPFCTRCGAWRGQLGLEPDPYLFIENLVEIFAHVHRVLHEDGVLWLNMGDCYSTQKGQVGNSPGGGAQGVRWRRERGANGNLTAPNRMKIEGYKPKDLLGLPWMLAFALRQWGWYLRCDCIWDKPNPMPESVRDRPTRSHEYLFLLTKSERYFYDCDAIAEPSCAAANRPQRAAAERIAREKSLTPDHLAALRAVGVSDAGQAKHLQSGSGRNAEETQRLADEAKAALNGYSREFLIAEKRNARSVWSIPTKPCGEAHFAVMAEELARRCILSGCPENGVVLDPFAGSGTSGLVAQKYNRRAILCDSNPDYIEIQRKRLNVAQGVLFS